MVISAPDAFVRVVSEQDEIAPKVEHTLDPSLPVGATRVLSKGKPGEVLKVYRVYVVDGVESQPVLTSETVTVAPRKRVVAVGSAKKPVPRTAASATRRGAKDKAPARGGARLRVTATAYSPQQAGLSDHTATGARARHGVVAVDPSVIPLGTRLRIPGYGWAVAADTGGGIRGRHIDLCFDTVAEARAWGRRSVTVTIAD
jgi:3D (Asp-Asp-Asp) domain-containing protein